MHKGVLRFSVEKFLCHSTETFRRGTFVSKSFGYRKILCIRGDITIFCQKYCLSTEKLCRGTLLYFRKLLVSKLFIHKRGAVSRFSVVIIKLKNVSKGWDSNPYLPLQNPVVVPTVPWEPVEFLTNVSEIITIFGTTETRTRTYCFRTLLS